MDGDNRALTKRPISPSGGSLHHLIRVDCETSLCSILRAQLGSAGGFDELVCSECLAWLPKRMDSSEAHPRVRPAPEDR